MAIGSLTAPKVKCTRRFQQTQVVLTGIRAALVGVIQTQYALLPYRHLAGGTHQ